jgi:uncharacterized protein (UPF0335 family)
MANQNGNSARPSEVLERFLTAREQVAACRRLLPANVAVRGLPRAEEAMRAAAADLDAMIAERNRMPHDQTAITQIVEQAYRERDLVEGFYAQANRQLHTMIDRIRSLEAEVKRLRDALEAARTFIGDEYRDPKAEALEGHHIANEARPVWHAICAALEAKHD